MAAATKSPAQATITAVAPGLSRKLKKVLECRTDSPDLLSSLSTLSSFYTSNTSNTRRNLRSTIEKRSLSINEEFLTAFESAQKVLDAVEQEVAGLAESCNKISQALNSSSSATGDIISTTERLKQELENTTQRQEIVSCFLRDYQLSPEEVNALREDELNEDFFKALSRVQEIHSNCKMLLRTHHQRAGLELMDMMAVYQEGAYERLCRWVQAECRKLGDTDTPEVHDALRTAARCLKDRPVLFKYCAEEVANTRHNSLFRRFISALTRGGPGGMPRPIEVHAHDPLRYVGDMLAWLHQALASERELIAALFSPDGNDRPTSRRFSNESDGDYMKQLMDTSSILDRIFEGVCRPFKVRVEQVLQSQPSLLLAYKLSNVLEFYTYTISDLLGEETSLSITLLNVKDAAVRTFFDILKTRGDKLLRYPSLVAADLSPPPAVAEGVAICLELIDAYNSMLVPASGKKPDFEPVIDALLSPIIQMCEQAAQGYKSTSLPQSLRRNSSGFDTNLILGHRSSLSSMEDILSNSVSEPSSQIIESLRKIFLINCLSAIQQPLMGQEIAATFVKGLITSIKGHIASLVENEVKGILERCGLLRKISLIEDHIKKCSQKESLSQDDSETSKPLAEIDGLSLSSISESLRKFFGFLASSEVSLPEFQQLQVPSLRTEVCSQFSWSLAESYELVYSALTDPKNGYPEAKCALRHSPDQLRTILGI
eukprot:TRINITY_DN4109_c0_g1_i1.p1 TRINITY_DN4109_c0_g1~~TRINITY_DN4109_c0_g1_i1.p1  ORF type:complete len:715 (-),score=139.77 TRINITY_DN4109_c0_g1_i1:315-2459(-)